jgi:drug/metabolite transporter (DMT)-like permease
LSLTDLGMLLVVLIWGGNLTITRAAFSMIDPLSFLALRFGIGAVLLIAVLLATGDSLRIDPELRWRVVWVGLIGNTLYQFMFQFGLSLTTAANTALLLATGPLWMALIGTLRGTERLTPAAWGGVALSFGGIALVLAGRGVAIAPETLLGDLLVLGSALCWSLYTLGAKPLLARYSALKATTLTMLSGTPLLIVAGLPSLLGLGWASVPIQGWGGLLYSAVLSLVVAYVIWYSSVQRVGTVRTAVYGNLVPVVGVLIAWWFGNEQISMAQIAGAGAILAGMWLARR